MKFLQGLFSERQNPPNSLKFGALLIITYGRSGSTLLQGVLNSIDGVVVRGENNKLFFHLFEAYKALMASKKKSGKFAQNPFFGVELLNEQYFLEQCKDIGKTLLLADRKNSEHVKCYGFKEVRYIKNLSELSEFLIFLEKIFPNPCFVFNTRNREDVVKSWIKVGWKKEGDEDKALKALEKAENVFFECMAQHADNSFHITYEDVVAKTEKLEGLFDFIGAPYDIKKIEKTLAVAHSYQVKIKK